MFAPRSDPRDFAVRIDIPHDLEVAVQLPAVPGHPLLARRRCRTGLEIQDGHALRIDHGPVDPEDVPGPVADLEFGQDAAARALGEKSGEGRSFEIGGDRPARVLGPQPLDIGDLELPDRRTDLVRPG
jgi:hypothetical protein